MFHSLHHLIVVDDTAFVLCQHFIFRFCVSLFPVIVPVLFHRKGRPFSSMGQRSVNRLSQLKNGLSVQGNGRGPTWSAACKMRWLDRNRWSFWVGGVFCLENRVFLQRLFSYRVISWFCNENTVPLGWFPFPLLTNIVRFRHLVSQKAVRVVEERVLRQRVAGRRWIRDKSAVVFEAIKSPIENCVHQRVFVLAAVDAWRFGAQLDSNSV